MAKAQLTTTRRDSRALLKRLLGVGREELAAKARGTTHSPGRDKLALTNESERENQKTFIQLFAHGTVEPANTVQERCSIYK